LQRLKRDTESARLPAATSAGVDAGEQRRILWKVIVPAAVAVAVLAVGGYFYFHRTPKLTDKDTIVLADFMNTTGDDVFDDTLKQALATELQQSPFFNILSDRKVGETLKLMGRTADQRLDEKTALDVCQRTRNKAVLVGSIASLGSQYVVGLNALNCQTGDSLARAEAQASGKEDVLNALNKAATKVRERVGESLSMIQKYDTPITEATTPSIEALKAYALEGKAQRAKGDAAAIPLLKRAIELDPNFAAAYASLGTSYSNIGEDRLASENLKKAYRLRERVSERERLNISAEYYTVVTGELEKARQTYELWVQTYPRDDLPSANLGSLYNFLGQYEKAVAETLKALHLDADNSMAYGNLIGSYSSLLRLDDATAIFRQATARKLENPFLYESLYEVAFLRGDAAEMQRLVAWATGKAGAEDVLLSYQSDTEAFFGRLGKARDFSRRAVESARRADEKETAAYWQVNAALREAEFGNAAQAHNETAAALGLASTREIKVPAALSLARVGDSAQALKLVHELEKQNPLHTAIIAYWLPTVRAALEISRDEPAKAIETLQAATSYELGSVGPLYPAYVRGQGYLLLHKGNEAAAEFQKFLDHRGVVANCPLGALAHLGLARAYSMQGDTAKAKAAYQDFLTLWKDADPDIPILIVAKAEYAKLKQLSDPPAASNRL
jgi:eukaryotic-like serine/threonine-protein kinase